MITRGEISPRQLCLILFDQGVLDYDDATVNKLKTDRCLHGIFS